MGTKDKNMVLTRNAGGIGGMLRKKWSTLRRAG